MITEVPKIIYIIVGYTSGDIICDKVLNMNWKRSVLGKCKVSYLSYIVDKYPNKVILNDLNMNPCVTDDLTHRLKNTKFFGHNPFNKNLGDLDKGHNLLWENPNFPYQKVIDEGIHKVKWHWIARNPNIPYEFLKKYRKEFVSGVIAKHPNSGDLLFSTLEKSLDLILLNPSLPFDKVLNWDQLFGNEKLIRSILKNPKLPMDLIRKYGFQKGKLDLLVLEHNENIRQILGDYSLKSWDTKRNEDINKSLLSNPSYYIYCVEEATAKCIRDIRI